MTVMAGSAATKAGVLDQDYFLVDSGRALPNLYP